MKTLRLLLSVSLLGLALAGCVDTRAPVSQPRPAPPARLDADTAASNFVAVVRRMEPLVEQECRGRTRGINCDYRIVVDERPGQPPNAFQTLDRAGRPVIGFTIPLIATMRNRDELAFVMGHEAAHHIAGHIPKTRESAMTGALFGGLIAAAAGIDVQAGQDFGATVGARRYSKEFELEADRLGTIITARAGYDPVRGARYFERAPDPGDRFLGTHPPNAQRLEVVRRTAAGL